MIQDMKGKSQSMHLPSIVKENTTMKTMEQSPRMSVNYSARRFHQKYRIRNFEVKLNKNLHIFHGLLYIQYEGFIRNDIRIQQVIIRDILKILSDKANSLKNLLMNGNRMLKILKRVSKKKQEDFNTRFETLIGYFQYISDIILVDYKNNYETLGIKESPINSYKNHKIYDELSAFTQNITLFVLILNFYRDCVDCFFILIRQSKKNILDKDNSNFLIKAISEARYSIGKLYEELLILEKVVEKRDDPRESLIGDIIIEKRDSTITKVQEIINEKSEIKEKNINDIEKIDDPKIEKKKKFKEFYNSNFEIERNLKIQQIKKLQMMLQNKFNFQTSKFYTRESKIPLNSTKLEIEQQIVQESGLKKIEFPVADNRLKLVLNRINNPFSQIKLN